VPRRVLLLVPVLVAGLAGCSTKIDRAASEKAIREAVTEQLQSDVRSVDCPRGLVAKKGATFSCQVTGMDGTRGTAQVTERDAKGNLSIRAPFLRVRDIERSIAKGMKRQVGRSVRVRCPQIVVAKAGDRFTCTALAGSKRTKVRVLQEDGQGRVRYALRH
jgi:hypothetical protein